MKTLEQCVKCVQIRNKNLEAMGGICSKLNKDTATGSEICWKSTIKTLEQCVNLFKVNNKDNKTMSEICSKLAIKTLGKYVKFADNEDTRRLRNLFKGNKNLEFAQGTKKYLETCQLFWFHCESPGFNRFLKVSWFATFGYHLPKNFNLTHAVSNDYSFVIRNYSHYWKYHKNVGANTKMVNTKVSNLGIAFILWLLRFIEQE